MGILEIRKMETASKTEDKADQTKQQLESEAEELHKHLKNLKILKSDPLQEKSDDEGDIDYNPAHDSSSDDESDEDENESEAHEISELKTKHKKTGLPLIEIKVNSAEVKIPPAK